MLEDGPRHVLAMVIALILQEFLPLNILLRVSLIEQPLLLVILILVLVELIGLGLPLIQRIFLILIGSCLPP